MTTIAKATQNVITRIGRSVHQTSVLWTLVQVWVGSITHPPLAATGAGLPRGTISPTRPNMCRRCSGCGGDLRRLPQVGSPGCLPLELQWPVGPSLPSVPPESVVLGTVHGVRFYDRR